MYQELLRYLVFQTNPLTNPVFDKWGYFNKAIQDHFIWSKALPKDLCLTVSNISLLVMAALWLKYIGNAYNRLHKLKIYNCMHNVI